MANSTNGTFLSEGNPSFCGQHTKISTCKPNCDSTDDVAITNFASFYNNSNSSAWIAAENGEMSSILAAAAAKAELLEQTNNMPADSRNNIFGANNIMNETHCEDNLARTSWNNTSTTNGWHSDIEQQNDNANIKQNQQQPSSTHGKFFALIVKFIRSFKI